MVGLHLGLELVCSGWCTKANGLTSRLPASKQHDGKQKKVAMVYPRPPKHTYWRRLCLFLFLFIAVAAPKC